MRGGEPAQYVTKIQWGMSATYSGSGREVLLAYAHVEFDLELLQKTGGGTRILRHYLVGEHRVELDVELAQNRLKLQRR